MGGAAGDQRPLAAAMTAPPTGQPTTKRNAMGQSSEDWQSYRLGERIIHTPAVHGAGWLALGWQRLNGLDAPMPPADAKEEVPITPADEVGAASVSEVVKDAEAEPSLVLAASEAIAAAAEDPTAGSTEEIDLQAMTKAAIITAMQQRHGVLLDRGLSKSALLAAARELEQAEHGSVAR